jgi:8-oxo-dGTP pyrophosphatase MutT (NUDIX family)
MISFKQKYKVFINDNWIFFDDFSTSQDIENEEHELLEASNNLLFNLAMMIRSGRFNTNIRIIPNAEMKNPIDLFLREFSVLEAAGGVVLNTQNELLMIERFRVWDFPKGKMEKNENCREAAVREVEEETGVNGLEIVNELPTTFHIYRFRNEWIVKKTYWFLMSTRFAGTLNPQVEEDILRAEWVPNSKVLEYISNSYASLKELVLSSGIVKTQEL